MTHQILDDLLAQPAFALIRGRENDRVTLIGGPRLDVEKLAEVPLAQGAGPAWDHLVLVPFAQVAERGFEAHQDGTPLSVIEARLNEDVALADLLEVLPSGEIELADRGGFETSDEEYAAMARRIIDDEIGQGEGANLVIGRRYRATVADWGHAAALSVFRRLLERERGAFWTFCIFTGDRYLIGASPERHVSLDAGQLRMNPISGTFRMRGLETHAERKRELLKFLSDEKEIYELFMVVDEELKMMCDLCHEGGLVLGPYLKPMSHLVHTEYLLAGRTDRDPRDILRDSMFAATVTGSPVENACRLIKQYEPQGRGYYASVAALIGRDEQGAPRLDAPILIRTADVDLDGNLTVAAGATLVRDSDAEYETKETWAKASGVLSAFGLVESAPEPVEGFDAFTREDDVLIALGSRNQRLSQFWLSDQSGTPRVPSLSGKRVVVLDGEDDFVNMLSHVFGVMGMTTDIVRHDEWTESALDDHDLVVIGPGPGDPRDGDDPKISVLRRATRRLLDRGQPFLAICLGHQTLCDALGLDLVYKDIVFQGTQSALPVLGRTETVGFYNTFVGRVPESGLPQGVTVESDPESGDIHLVAGPHYRGIQFHAESILTQNGYGILRELTEALLG
ncbi:anthranilate synthase family protein [Aeromicrobium duanguangcaii]|uniref:anthranilate synthase n=1 Tax=Aeromicrobium duanguangcaii TaxID=2968086 RepID=A0ABY5KD20_9ACTN|nr:anthranilate synthase family protein [Aeromicrobium duanguangcaii]MCD9155372.1 anthranilate synthase family protein [Aeromicrobium duanguangcaii]MCL3838340.1 anthranilate synthase family protein [Aeromicrobium duanguangcaii]UUI68356.1 anthranilate synthase family protein [Aeromicrobium duanguangcaii]